MAGYWPEAPERINRMFEAIEIIDKLFTASLAGKDTKLEGRFYKLETTRLWTMDERPPILVATAGPITAKRAGKAVDGLITVGAPLEKISGLFERFDAGQRRRARTPRTRRRCSRSTSRGRRPTRRRSRTRCTSGRTAG